MAGTLQVDGCARAFSCGRARSVSLKKKKHGWVGWLFNSNGPLGGVEYGVIFTEGDI